MYFNKIHCLYNEYLKKYVIHARKMSFRADGIFFVFFYCIIMPIYEAFVIFLKTAYVFYCRESTIRERRVYEIFEKNYSSGISCRYDYLQCTCGRCSCKSE